MNNKDIKIGETYAATRATGKLKRDNYLLEGTAMQVTVLEKTNTIRVVNKHGKEENFAAQQIWMPWGEFVETCKALENQELAHETRKDDIIQELAERGITGRICREEITLSFDSAEKLLALLKS